MHITTVKELKAKTSDAWRAEAPVLEFFRRSSILVSVFSGLVAVLAYWLG